MKKIERFMVIDDDPITNFLCEHILKKAFEPTAIMPFTAPEKALKTITVEYGSAGHRVNTVLLLDINMPTMSGWEFLAEFNNLAAVIREQFTIFILSSSIDYRDNEKAAQNASVSGFLCKPFSIKAIQDLLESNYD